MDKNSLAHTTWECKYHIVFAPKFRRKVIYQQIRADIGHILSELCKRKGIEIIEAEACPDHIHMLVRIPPKYSVSEIMGYLKGKSSQISGNLEGVYYNIVSCCRDSFYFDYWEENPDFLELEEPVLSENDENAVIQEMSDHGIWSGEWLRKQSEDIQRYCAINAYRLVFASLSGEYDIFNDTENNTEEEESEKKPEKEPEPTKK